MTAADRRLTESARLLPIFATAKIIAFVSYYLGSEQILFSHEGSAEKKKKCVEEKKNLVEVRS